MAAARARQPYPEVVQAIMRGDYDADLSMIQSAAAARIKNMWRRGTQVRLVGTKNVELEGKTGVITKVNQKSISVGLGAVTHDQWGTTYADGEYNVSPGLLERVEVQS